MNLRSNIPLLLLAASAAALAAEKKDPPVSSMTHVVRPERRDFSEQRMRQLKLPAGFQINVFAQGLGNVRMLAVTPDGTILATCPKEGEVIALKDADGDGKAEHKETVLSLPDVHGIALRDNYVYLTTTKKLLRTPLKTGKWDKPEALGKELPDGGQHGRRTIAFGPDGALYLSIGSTCNNCEETNPEHATLLKVNPQTWDRVIFAKGLRNTIGFAWHPQTQELWGMDHGSDDRGDDIPPEELNQIREGDYGWPFAYGQKLADAKANPPKDGTTKEARAAQSIAPVLEYQAHSAPIGLVFYNGSQFPNEYRNDAFVVMRGSWNRKPATGYKVVRARFENGKPKEFQDFVSGFLIEDGKAHFGRLAGLAVAPDGSLLISEDTNGMIYRVSYKK